jgi:YVTN family beta-propeller protein
MMLSKSLCIVSLLAAVLLSVNAEARSSNYEVWVTDQAVDKVLVFDGKTLKPLAETLVDDDGQPATSKPHFVSFSPDYKYAYIANVGKNNVTVIDAAKRKVIAQVPAGKGAHAAIASPDGKRVWVANPGDGSVTEILVQKDSFIPGRTFSSVGTRTMVLTFSSDGRLAYVTNSGDANATEAAQTGSIVVMDVESGQMIKQLENTGKNTLVPVWSADGSQLYVSVGDPANQILTLSTVTGPEELIFGPTDAGIKDAHGVAVTPNGTLVLVSRQEAKVQLFDSSLVNVGSIAVGEKPDMVALSLDGKMAYVTLRGQAVTGDPFALSGPTPGLAVIDLVKGERSQLIVMSGDPHGVAVRPMTGKRDYGHRPLWMIVALLLAGVALLLFLRR